MTEDAPTPVGFAASAGSVNPGLEPRVECNGGCGLVGAGGLLRAVAVLYARADSIYKTLPGCDVWDMDRDARKYDGSMPIVAHPPCRAWGQLAHMANPRPDEKDLARSAVRLIREHGGVLEHPSRSKLWPDQGLPEPGSRDQWVGFTVAVPQFWFGHRAEKNTRFYVCGCSPKDLPEIPFTLGECTHLIGAGSREAKKKKLGIPVKPEVSRYEREATPAALAVWLVKIARLCFPSGRRGCGAGDENSAQHSGAGSQNDQALRPLGGSV